MADFIFQHPLGALGHDCVGYEYSMVYRQTVDVKVMLAISGASSEPAFLTPGSLFPCSDLLWHGTCCIWHLRALLTCLQARLTHSVYNKKFSFRQCFDASHFFSRVHTAVLMYDAFVSMSTQLAVHVWYCMQHVHKACMHA